MENENSQISYSELLKRLKDAEDKNAKMANELKETNEKLDKTTETIAKMQETINQSANMINNIMDFMYNMSSRDCIESSLNSISNIGKTSLGVEDCTFYSVNNLNNQLFTANEYGTREYIYPDDASMIKKAIDDKKPIMFDINKNVNIGDSKLNDNLNAKNALIVPLENRFGDMIGVAVCKGKDNGFTQKHIDAFYSTESGSIGNFFRVAIESRTNSLQATTDKLTGLNNRQGMENFIKANITERINNEQSVSVVVFDIDKFKKFNDTYGHTVGDDCLKLVADVIKNNLRATNDTGAFRFGGEEFIVVLPTGEGKAKEIVDRIRGVIADTPFKVGNEEVKITVSAGVAQMSPDTYNLSNEEVINLFDKTFVIADTALYQSKENGRNRVTASYEVDEDKILNAVTEFINKQDKENKTETINYSKEKTEAIEYVLSLAEYTIEKGKNDNFLIFDNANDTYLNNKEGKKSFTKQDVKEVVETIISDYGNSFIEKIKDYAEEEGININNDFDAVEYLLQNEDVKKNIEKDGYSAMYNAINAINNFDEVDFSSITNNKPQEKDFSIHVSEDEDYLIANDDGFDVHIESVGISHLENMMYDAVKSGEIPKEIADEVLDDNSSTYYDMYVNFKQDGNDSLTLAITTETGEKYYATYDADMCPENFIETVAEEVRDRENKSVDEIINDFEENDFDL